MNNIAVIQRVTLVLLNSDFLVWDNVLRFDYKRGKAEKEHTT